MITVVWLANLSIYSIICKGKHDRQQLLRFATEGRFHFFLVIVYVLKVFIEFLNSTMKGNLHFLSLLVFRSFTQSSLIMQWRLGSTVFLSKYFS